MLNRQVAKGEVDGAGRWEFLVKRNAENREDAEGDAENFEGGRADPARSADFWLWRADLIVASSLGNEEERDNKVPPPYFTNSDARQYKQHGAGRYRYGGGQWVVKGEFQWVDGVSVLGRFFRDSLACSPGGGAPPWEGG